MTPETSKSTTYMEIDEGGSYRLKGKEDSDHNKFIMEVIVSKNKEGRKKTRYNMKDSKKWKYFNEKLHETYNRDPQKHAMNLNALKLQGH